MFPRNLEPTQVMNILEQLTEQLGGDNLKALSQQLGVEEGQASAGISAALPMLMGALAKNASSDDGAAKLSAALDKDHGSGGVMDQLSGFLSDSDNGSGAGILGHLLGGQRSGAEAGLAQISGLSQGAAGGLLENLAPVVMGFLGKQKQQQGLDASGLASILGQQSQQASSSPGMGLLSNLLDRDGDGSVVDDVAGMVGKFFKK